MKYLSSLAVIGLILAVSGTAEALTVTNHQDSELPLAGEGYFYLIQAWNLECGGGDLGFGAGEVIRVPTDGCESP